MTDTEMLMESAKNALTSLESKDALIHPRHPSADPDISYTIMIALITALADSCLTLIDTANHAEPLAFNVKKRTPVRDAYLLTSFTMDNAYPNVLPDSLMLSVIANLANKILVTFADLKIETTASTAILPSLFHKDIAFLIALLEDSEMETDAESATLHALLALREAHVLLARLNSISTKDAARPNAQPEKSLFSIPVLLVKTLIA